MDWENVDIDIDFGESYPIVKYATFLCHVLFSPLSGFKSTANLDPSKWYIETKQTISFPSQTFQKFVSSGCVEHLDFLPLWTATGDYFQRLREVETGRSFRSLDDLPREVAATASGPPLARTNGSVYVPSGQEVVRIMHAMDRKCFQSCSESQLLEHAFYPGEDPFSLASRVAAMHELTERNGLDFMFTYADRRHCVRDYLTDLSRMAGIQQVCWLLEAMKLQLEHESIGDQRELTPFNLDDPGTPTVGPAASVTGHQRSLGACHLYNLPPCMVKDLLLRTLRAGQLFSCTPTVSDRMESLNDSTGQQTEEPRTPRRRFRIRRQPETTSNRPSGSVSRIPDALFQRQLDGCLGRVPPTFYQALYTILERSPHGVLICNKLLSQKPTLTDMTPYDLNFIDEVEWLLRPIGDPAYRSLFVETVMVIAVILDRNKELSFKDTVDIKLVIQDAMAAFTKDRHEHA
ncbi:unnamed protein product [Echinostoma caproni]|uniref:Phosphorylase b kinase regulatory subunit n=1 Tax=Echinostoma caproni TaxID=27848 RepID=A0A183AQE8_9TREM|nr:unnamed protein product [Echinostoma caproni]